VRGDLSHICNPTDEHRRAVLEKHQRFMERLFAKYPELEKNYDQVERIKKQIISTTLAKLKGQALDNDVTQLEQRLGALRQERSGLLKKFSIDPQSLQPQWDCPRCQDTGRVYLKDGRYVACDCLQSKRAASLRTASALPARLLNASFSQVDISLYQPQFRQQARNIFSYVQRFCDDLPKKPGQGLFIHGPTGSGKSYLMGCIANKLSGEMSVKYLVYADFLDNLRATYSSNKTDYSEHQMIDAVKKVDLLLLDDLGVEKPTEFAYKNLAQIIDYRYRNCLPLVVTSNFTLQELIKRSQADLYGERIVWRLSESCSNILELKGNLRLSL